MIIDFSTAEDITAVHTDVCIVGAGPAGLSIAQSFAGSRIQVCLVESGGFDFDPHTQALYAGHVVGIPYFPLDVTRLRFFGGSSNHWAGQCGALESTDFMVRDWIPFSGWPISREDLVSYYIKANEVIGLGDFEYGQDNLKTLGLEPMPLKGEALKLHFWRQSHPPKRFGEAYRDIAATASNLTVLLNANVIDIEANESASRVNNLKIKTLTGKQGQVTAKFYVLACGGIETPRLLLNANSVMPRGLGNQNDLVGRFFMEHPNVPLGKLAFSENFSEIYDHLRFWDDPKHPEVPLLGAFSLTAGHQERERTLNGSIRILFRETGMLGNYPGGFGAKAQYFVCNIKGVLRNIYRNLADGWPPFPIGSAPVGLVLEAEQAPNPDSRVILADDSDALGLRVPALDWQLTDLDRQTCNAVLDAFVTEMGRGDWGRVQIAEWLSQASGWPDDMVGGNHHMGTTRMADTPRLGVVDRDCRVYGIDNLYIAGSSVFPTGGYVNPTLTITALSLRLADHLKARVA